MLCSIWDERLKPLQGLIMKPVIFNNLSVTLLDVLSARHSKDMVVENHRHPWFEFNFLSEGKLFTTIEGCEFLTAPGHFFLIPPGNFHSHRHCDYVGDDGFCLRWQLDDVSSAGKTLKMFNTAGEIIKTLSIVRPYSIKYDAGEFVSSACNITGTGLQAAFIQWLVSLYDLLGENYVEAVNENDREKILVEQALLYLSQYYANDFTVQELSNALNLSYRHLARIFKHITGVTIIEKLNDIRVNEAKKLLKDTDKTIREIAEETGFENEYYFSTVFKRYSYVTPSEFRNRFKG